MGVMGVGGLVSFVMLGRMMQQVRGEIARLEDRSEAVAVEPPLLGNELATRLIERLMDTSLPAREIESARGEEPPGSPGEYEPPFEPMPDWTDPFFGIERETVGGLRPGQGIPGIGADDEGARWQENGEEAFDHWQQQEDARHES